MKKDKQKCKRLLPCPAYDIEGTEGWLAQMAQQGWLLCKDGIFACVASFERGETKNVRYRLTAALKSTSMWADSGGMPDAEEVELGEKYGWEYVATRGEFYIYRTFNPDARELNTDPEVQAAAVDAVRRRQNGSVFNVFFWAVIYPVCHAVFRGWGGLFLTAVSVRTWFFLLTWAAMLCPALLSLRTAIHLGKLQKRLKSGEALTPCAPAKRQTRAYYGRKAAVFVLFALWAAIALRLGSADVMDEGKIPLAQYSGTLPFATLTDLAGPGVGDHEYTPSFGTDLTFNHVQEWSDWLAPRNIKWAEHAAVTRADGTVLKGGLYIDYHEAATEWVAERLMRDYIRMDRLRWKDNAPLDLSPLDADEARAYIAVFPTVVFRKGNIVVRAGFSQNQASEVELALSEWAGVIADSVKEEGQGESSSKMGCTGRSPVF